MKKIDVISGEQKLDGEKIRYIELDKQKYIIYTLNEIDDDGYEKLYINKYVDNEEDLISDISWDELKKEIPNIVKQIRNKNITSFIDLELSDIEKVSLNYARPFKLKVNIVNSIKKDAVELENEQTNPVEEIPNTESEEKSNINDLDKFLEDLDKDNNENKQEKEERNLTEIELEIEQLNEELDRQKQTNELLQNKIIELEIELSNYKKKLNDIKIMIDQS